MENLQNEVQHILEKYAKYKIGQEAYIASHELKDCFTYRKVKVDEIILEYNYCNGYVFKYICKGNRYYEDDLFSSLNELKECMINQCMQVVDMWKKAIDINVSDEVKEHIREIGIRRNN